MRHVRNARLAIGAHVGACVALLVGSAAWAQDDRGAAKGDPAPIDSAAAAVTSALVSQVTHELAAQRELAAALDETARELHDLFEAALEVHASDPKTTEAAFERLPRPEQIAWRIAHLRGNKDALTRLYAAISDEVEEERDVPLAERTSLNALVERFAAGGERLEQALGACRVVGATLPASVSEEVERARAQWELFEARLVPSTFFPRRGRDGAAVERATLLTPEGFFFVAEGEAPLDSYTDLLTLAPGDVPARPDAYVPFTVDLLFEVQGLIDPIERLISALRLEQEQLELEQLRRVISSSSVPEGVQDAATPGQPADAGLSAPARVSKAIERFVLYRETLVDALRESYQRFLQQGRGLGQTLTPGELLATDARELSPEVHADVLRALELAQREVGEATTPPLAEVRRDLGTTLERWRAELASSPGGTLAEEPAAYARRVLLVMQQRGKERRLDALDGTLRREQSRLRVARKLLADALQRVVSVDLRIRGFDELWKRAAADHYGHSAVRVVAIVAAAWVLLRLLAAASTRIVERLSSGGSRFTTDAEARLTTLQSVFVATLRVIVWVTAALMVLAQFDINYEPLLLATGGVTLAVGFGAQSLVKDFFSGFFILLENQFTVGDVIEVDGKAGAVESVDLRTTRLRAADGTLHIFPNGQIAAVSNLTHTWARMNLLVSVAYSEDPDEVVKAINRLGEEMFADPECRPLLLEAPHVWGLDGFGTNSVDFRVAAKTRPGDQWTVSREFRRRLKVAFDLAGIEIPCPTVNHVAIAERPSSKVLRRRRPGGRSGPTPTPAPVPAVIEASVATATAEVADTPGIDPEAEGHRMPG